MKDLAFEKKPETDINKPVHSANEYQELLTNGEPPEQFQTFVEAGFTAEEAARALVKGMGPILTTDNGDGTFTHELAKPDPNWPAVIDACEVCGSTENLGDLWLGLDDIPTDLKLVILVKEDEKDEPFRVCEACHDDPAKLKTWLMAELEKALRESGEFEQLPDGKWKRMVE